MSNTYHFLNIPRRAAADPKAPYAVLPVPYERTVSFGPGTVKGPAAILRASHELEDFDEELQIPVSIPVQTLPPADGHRLGDAAALTRIRARAAAAMESGRFLLSLGGEHTVSAPLIAAARAAFGPLSVLHLDAHTDLRDAFRGTRLSHACVMRRVRDLGVPTVHVGMRSSSSSEAAYIRKEKVPVFWAKDIRRTESDRWMDRVVRLLSRQVYVSLDIDVMEPAAVPGTGTPEPGGLDWYQVTGLLRRVFRQRTVVAADIVETAPIPGAVVSEFTAARLGLKMLVYHRYRNRL